MHHRLAPFAFAATVALAAPASAQTTAITPTAMAAYLRTQGLLVETIPSGTRIVLKSEFEGAKFLVYFTGCNTASAACGSMQFYAGFKTTKPTTVQAMNEWNRTKRYSRAYIDNDGDPCVEMDVPSAGGTLPKIIVDDIFENWRLTMRLFKRAIFTSTPS